MAGWMGTGKSTIASAVGSATGAVVLDHDTTKTAIMSAAVSHPPAGAASYEVLFALAGDLLGRGHSVIIDSPAAYASVPQRGLALAEAASVPYYFAECDCPEEVAHRRVDERTRRPSQVRGPSHAAAVRADPRREPHQPARGVLRLDTTVDLASCTQHVLSYLEGAGAAGPVEPSALS